MCNRYHTPVKNSAVARDILRKLRVQFSTNNETIDRRLNNPIFLTHAAHFFMVHCSSMVIIQVNLIKMELIFQLFFEFI